MQIHELNSFVGTPGAGDYLAIDDGSETTKVEASNLGVTTQMTQAEAEAGTVTASRVVTPSIFKSAVTAIASAITGVFVSMTNPKYTLDTSATSGDDYNLTQALTSLGWLSDVVTSGVLGGKKLLYKILSKTMWTQILGRTDANGTYSLSRNLTNCSEILVEIIIGSRIRSSFIIPIDQFISFGAMPDFTAGTLRGYVTIMRASDTTVTFSGINGVSAWGSNSGFALYAR